MRQPINILAFPFYIAANNSIKYAIFKRSDEPYWQAISGGVEDNETIWETAKRECFEEAAILDNCEFFKLDSTSSVPKIAFSCYLSWGTDVYVVKEYSFGVRVKELKLVISKEHTEANWFTYEEAMKLLKWQSNKVVLWELNERLLRSVL